MERPIACSKYQMSFGVKVLFLWIQSWRISEGILWMSFHSVIYLFKLSICIIVSLTVPYSISFKYLNNWTLFIYSHCEAWGFGMVASKHTPMFGVLPTKMRIRPFPEIRSSFSYSPSNRGFRELRPDIGHIVRTISGLDFNWFYPAHPLKGQLLILHCYTILWNALITLSTGPSQVPNPLPKVQSPLKVPLMEQN